jgi:isorenieratene synthase
MSAALELAERGYAVTIRESMDVLGGRLATPRLHTRAGEFAVEHGLHMWFDNYHTFKDIRRRLGIDRFFRPYREVYTIFRDYEPEVLQSEPPVYPINMVAMLQRSPNMNLFSAFRQLRMLPTITGYDHARVYERLDHLTFEEWMSGRVSQTFADVFLRPASSVTLNDPSRISAAEMALYMHYFFIGQPRAMWREITTHDHATAILDPWRDRLLELGAQIELGRPCRGLRFADGRALGEVGTNERFDHVVLALDVPGLKSVVRGSVAYDEATEVGLQRLAERAGALEIAPPYKVMRLWFDRQPDPSRWDVIETPQHHPINLLAQFHLMEAESAAWAERTGGSIIEAHLYANPMWGETRDEDVWSAIRPTFLEILPEMADARILDSVVGSYHNFTSFAVGQGSIRPAHDTAQRDGLSNVGLAGDWVHTDFPSALMERAVATGREAANLCLYADGVRAAPITMTSNHGPGLV